MEVYSATASHPINIVKVKRGTFEYYCDLYSGLEALGELPFDQMEKYCLANPGTFCFSRPLYADTTSVPRWLEFGLIRQDGKPWVEIFKN